MVSELNLDGIAELIERLGGDEHYQSLLSKLNTFFEKRGRGDYEDCATEVMFKVSGKIAAGEKIENIAGYCYGIAKFIFLEKQREDNRFDQLPDNDREEASTIGNFFTAGDGSTDCEKRLIDETKRWIQSDCFKELPLNEQELLIRYYVIVARGNKEELAEELGITYSALTQRVLKIKNKLQECVRNRLDKSPAPRIRQSRLTNRNG
jgi:RNA polymerase sigma factor (sigma-70 family)